MENRGKVQIVERGIIGAAVRNIFYTFVQRAEENVANQAERTLCLLCCASMLVVIYLKVDTHLRMYVTGLTNFCHWYIHMTAMSINRYFCRYNDVRRYIQHVIHLRDLHTYV